MDLTTSTTTLRSLSERRLLSLGLYERIALKVEMEERLFGHGRSHGLGGGEQRRRHVQVFVEEQQAHRVIKHNYLWTLLISLYCLFRIYCYIKSMAFGQKGHFVWSLSVVVLAKTFDTFSNASSPVSRKSRKSVRSLRLIRIKKDDIQIFVEYLMLCHQTRDYSYFLWERKAII